MSDIVNLRQFKKRAQRNLKEKQAEQNRILFGRTKLEKQQLKQQKQKDKLFLTNNKLEKDDNDILT